MNTPGDFFEKREKKPYQFDLEYTYLMGEVKKEEIKLNELCKRLDKLSKKHSEWPMEWFKSILFKALNNKIEETIRWTDFGNKCFDGLMKATKAQGKMPQRMPAPKIILNAQKWLGKIAGIEKKYQFSFSESEKKQLHQTLLIYLLTVEKNLTPDQFIKSLEELESAGLYASNFKTIIKTYITEQGNSLEEEQKVDIVQIARDLGYVETTGSLDEILQADGAKGFFMRGLSNKYFDRKYPKRNPPSFHKMKFKHYAKQLRQNQLWKKHKEIDLFKRKKEEKVFRKQKTN